MGYPVGPLLAALAHRILYNLDLIESMAPKWGTPEQDRPPFSDTQLLISLLGVLVFPHEKAPAALGEIMRGYKPLHRVLTVLYSRHGPDQVEMTSTEGEPVMVDHAKLSSLPRLLRNSLAHFNILPINKEGRFAGIRIWNRDLNEQITFVADMDFDPMAELEAVQGREIASSPKVPHLNRDIWKRLVEAHGGDAGTAKTTLDRLMVREVEKLLAAAN